MLAKRAGKVQRASSDRPVESPDGSTSPYRDRCFSGELEVRAPDHPMLRPDYALELLIEASNRAGEAVI
jgi:hypothetical protein